MSTTKHTGHVGALAVAVGAAVMLVTTTAGPVPVSPAVNLSASTAPCTDTGVTCALIMGGTSIPTWNDADVDVIMNQFIAPTHSNQDIEPISLTTPEEGWPVTGIIRLLGVALGPPSIFGPGGAGRPDEPWWRLSGLFDLTYDQSIHAGLVDLEQAMAEHPNDHLVIYGYSQGATIADLEKQKLADQYPAGTTAPDIDFVLSGDPNLPNGGLLARFPGLYLPIGATFYGAEPTDTQFDTVVVTRQYDPVADFPLYPLNVISLLNAVLGAPYVHLYPFDVSLPLDPTKTSPAAYQSNYGDTDYYFFETKDLPLFGPLRTLGVPEPVIDVVEPFFREIVELGYDRSIEPGKPTPARLIPTLDPVKVTVDLVNAVGEGIINAANLIGLPPPVKTPTPVTRTAPITEAVETDVSPQVTSKDAPTQTDRLRSTESATEDEQTASVPSTSTSEQVKPTLRRATPRPVVRDSLDATERPRAFPHRRNGSAAPTTEITTADPATTTDSTPDQSAPAAASNDSADDSSGGGTDDAA